MKLDLNSTECVRTVSDFSGRTVYNICNGTEATVPWGSVDVFVFALLALLLIAALLMFTAMMTVIIKDFW